MNLEPDSGPREEGINFGDIGAGPSDRTPAPMPKFADSDPELAWWNGEPEGVEPQ